MRSTFVIAGLLSGAGSVGMAAAVPAQAQSAPAGRSYDIPEQRLDLALNSFAEQSRLQIMFDPALVRRYRSRALKGNFAPAEGLKRLLTGSDLVAAPGPGGVYLVKAGRSTKGVGGSAESVRFAAEQTDDGASAGDAVQDIVVTAQKRSESSLDVPMSLTAISGEQLTMAQSFRLEDFVATVPGLQFVNAAGASLLIVRGLSIGGASVNSPVATYVDETPFTSQGAYSGSTGLSPNLDTFDMQRIEVLRGPQGTLYGANALAGLFKYATNAPSVDGVTGNVVGSVSSVAHGGVGYDLHGMINIPLSSDLAVRAVGYHNEYAGYIDDPSRDAEDINESNSSGGRISLLYQPSNSFSARLTAFHHETGIDGQGAEDVESLTLTPITREFAQQRFTDETTSTSNQIYNLTLKSGWDFADITSSTSYMRFKLARVTDNTPQFGALISGLLGSDVGVAYPNKTKGEQFTQELRASSDNGPLNWQVGAYFTIQTTKNNADLKRIDLATNEVVYDDAITIGGFEFNSKYREYAAFANIGYDIAPSLNIDVGGRYSHNDQDFRQTSDGLLGGGAIPVRNSSSEGVFTYSSNLSWDIHPSVMAYARIAKGFVPGGPNSVTPQSGAPLIYQSSTTMNYEVGLKGSFFDRKATFELTAFSIDWTRVQLQTLINGFGAIVNGGTAKSQGVEWNFVYRPTRSLTLNANGAYTDARLTSSVPATTLASSGDRLPYSPRWQFSAGAQYRDTVGDDLTAVGQVSWRYTGSRLSDFPFAGPRQVLPAYSVVNVEAGLERGDFTLMAFVKNIGDVRGFTYIAGLDATSGSGRQAAYRYQPRTIGIQFGAKF